MLLEYEYEHEQIDVHVLKYNELIGTVQQDLRVVRGDIVVLATRRKRLSSGY